MRLRATAVWAAAFLLFGLGCQAQQVGLDLDAFGQIDPPDAQIVPVIVEGGVEQPVDAPAACSTPLTDPKSVGQPCACANECASGFCTDGVCCSGPCNGVCRACNVPGKMGMCSSIPAGMPPVLASQCGKQPESSCGLDGTCDGTGACRKHPDGTICRAGKCQGNSVTGTMVCAAGVCKTGPNELCTPYLCDPANNACFAACTSNTQCDGRTCAGGSCGNKPLGAKCGGKDECDSGFCADGVCCNVACTGACMSCNQIAKMGACNPVEEGATDPRRICKDEGKASCGFSGSCNGQGGCAKYASGSVCKAASCAGDSLMPASVCDGKGTCVPGSPVGCAPNKCTDGACKVTCTENSDCVAPAVCNGGSCGKRGLGQSCARNDECAMGFCTDGVCCNEACGGQCRFCAWPSMLGRCTNVPVDTPDPRAARGVTDLALICIDQGKSSCGTNGRCNGTGGCQKYPVGTICRAESCNAISNSYVGSSTCAADGKCTPPGGQTCTPYKCNGNRCASSCGSNGDCQTPNICANGSCGKKSNGLLCGNDDECATGHCEQGVCCATACTASCFSCALPGASGTCAAVPAGGMDPALVCKDQGSASCGSDGTCNGSGGCRKYAAGVLCGAAFCKDGWQTTASSCSGTGVCQAGSTRNCSPYACNAGGTDCYDSCSDSAQCVGSNLCVSGKCGKKGLGASCTQATECSSGFCADGVCCNKACTAVCTSCALAGSPGTCSPIPSGGPDPDGGCAATDPMTCGNDGFCDGTGKCRKWGTTTVCRTASCPEGSTTLTKQAKCDGQGGCPASQTQSCGAFQCDSAANGCKKMCTVLTQAQDCAAGRFCTLVGDTFTCGLQAKGGPCDKTADCQSGLTCVDKTCCGSVSCAACKSCANSQGDCQAITAGVADPRCDGDGNPCGETGVCAEGGKCALTPAGTGCGNVCTTNKTAVQNRACDGSGTCAASGLPTSCGAYKCDDGGCLQSCTTDGDCSGTNVCSVMSCGPGKKSLGASCNDDDDCTSNSCVDKTCCASDSCGACRTCANASGTCADMAAGVSDSRCVVDGSICGLTGQCRAGGACAYSAMGTACGVNCSPDNAAITASTCDGAGMCKESTTTSCNGYICADGVCKSKCQDDADCISSNKCLPNGKCHPH